jgi:hypothetical protein
MLSAFTMNAALPFGLLDTVDALEDPLPWLPVLALP